jgi:GNAT superfamily N-acetyltransferase
MPNDGVLVRIRRATTEDVEELSALVLSAKAHWGYADAQLQAWRSSLEISAGSVSARPTFVGELNDLVIGFYSLVPAVEAWDLSDLWVLPRFMRQGFGRALLAHAAQTAAESGATWIVIDADPHAEPFYLGCGAARVGQIAAPIPGQPDRVRPQLRLAVNSVRHAL